MAISLSEPAIERVRHFLDNRGSGVGVRVGVTTTGCSGLAYLIEFVDSINSDDEVFEQDGVSIIIDKKSLVYLDGTEVDFVREGLNEGFEFKNPNQKGACGCGESFTV
ncbi:MAG: iron-sulfur cluster assembly protein IscA [Gammaproteobacteria bacterium]|nr:MAG: iron-sulfur cluster assembly protein IscA [Gammaproteobacteria bacterium]